MVKGLYTAHTGMVNEMKRLDILANNLANADTTAYKKEGTIIFLRLRIRKGSQGTSARIAST